MRIIEPSVTLLGETSLSYDLLKPFDTSELDEPCSDGARLVERAGRVCWKSEGKAELGSAAKFCNKVLGQFGHYSIAEHASATIHFVTDRIVSHQIVRSRIAAYSQESTHYLNYASGKFGRQISVCKPFRLIGVSESSLGFQAWKQAMEQAEESYFYLIEHEGWKHYEARYVLPMGLKTELVATYNFRMWKHVIDQRTLLNKHDKPVNTPEIHALMLEAGNIMSKVCPEIFSGYAR